MGWREGRREKRRNGRARGFLGPSVPAGCRTSPNRTSWVTFSVRRVHAPPGRPFHKGIWIGRTGFPKGPGARIIAPALGSPPLPVYIRRWKNRHSASTERSTCMDDQPWLKHYDPGVPHHIDVPPVPLHRFLEDAARKYGDRPCAIFKGHAVTYAEMDSLTDRLAAALVDLGGKKGNPGAIFLPNFF